VASDYLNDEYLTRSEIAAILKISPKQAGRLMDRMPTLRVGRRHRRVRRSDFEAWILRQRQVPIEPLPSLPREAAIRRARHIAGLATDGPGSVVMAAAAALKKRKQFAPECRE
jgi:hypothetical protein